MYADIIVDITHDKLDRVFQYNIPERLSSEVVLGSCVEIPFGAGNKRIKGYVVGFSEETDYDPAKIKDLIGLAPGSNTLEEKQLQLAVWLKTNFGSTLIQALKTVLPAKTTVKPVEHKRIVRHMTKEEIISLLGEATRKKQVAKARLLTELVDNESIPYELVTGKLMVSAPTVRSLETAGALNIEVDYSLRNPVKCSDSTTDRKQLSPGQENVVDSIWEDYCKGIRKTYLIHGITGSGKTEVYIRLIERVVSEGRQAIVLIPEIALTYQTLLRFYRHFGDRVSVLNSTLSAGEKYDQCERARNGEIDVIIGPRSALFTPFPNIGIIIMDEEHEASYKSEVSPKYHAREVAEEVARLHGASVVLGSATPSLEAFYRAEKGEYGFFELTERMAGGSLPTVYTVDLREELRQGNRSIFSMKLQELLEDRLRKGEQAMLFLNRRGVAGFISCRNCGEVIKCPHCDVSLSEHYGNKLICHYCGYSAPKPTTCPSCGSKYISGFKAGTEAIETKLKEMYPGVRTLRMDADTTSTKGSYEKILSSFAAGEADVLIGTQMIVKGHDFSNVTLVGVIAADISLNLGDYRSAERTFQLLTQAVGRAGRGVKPGEAVIQTYQPDHYAVRFAADQDYPGFYEEEILYREMAGYPPVENMLAVQIMSPVENNGLSLAQRLVNVLKSSVDFGGDKALMILGPAPASIGKIKDVYRFVFYIKDGDMERLVAAKDLLESQLKKWDTKETVFFDFNPMNIM